MLQTKSYAAMTAKATLTPFSFERREVGPRDILITITHCGICHSDIHQARDEWGGSIFPMVPGHEIVGTVTRVGTEVTTFKTGDRAGVGCFVDSCRSCASCREGLEQYCEKGMLLTYSGRDKDGRVTQGGYSTQIVVDEQYALRIPPPLSAAGAAPLLCAGITTYSPLRHWKVGPGQKVGIVGLGGLGHMGVKLARAFGAQVVLFTTSPGKADDAKRLGAHEVVVSTDEKQMAAHAGTFDFILDTVSAAHDLNAYLGLLKLDGTLTLVGVPEQPLAIHAFSVIMPRRNFNGSGIGGIAETQEMLDFCAEHGIGAQIEVIRAEQVNEAWDRVVASDVRYRFVIDVATMA